MRKCKILWFTAVTASLFLASCQKVIELDLSTTTPGLVIQGNVYDEPGPYIVKISKTVNFDTPNIYPAVTNATVSISDDDGNSENLSQTTDGIYVTSTLQGHIGMTYTLTVNVDGKTYSASSTMPEPVDIDTIYFKKSIFGGSRLIALDFNNLPGKENYYQVIHFVNGKQIPGFSVFSNHTEQVARISYSFMTTDSTPALVAGDKIDVWLGSIDKSVFEYFRTANRDGGRSASPANPVTNISNGALGYFNACSVRKKLFVYH
jgi:hypothetical protein